MLEVEVWSQVVREGRSREGCSSQAQAETQEPGLKPVLQRLVASDFGDDVIVQELGPHHKTGQKPEELKADQRESGEIAHPAAALGHWGESTDEQ